MSIENFLDEKNKGAPTQGSSFEKWIIVVLDMLWVGCLPLWALYLIGIGFMSVDRIGMWLAFLILASYFSFPVAIIYALSTSFRLFKLKEYRRGVRVSSLPFAWILAYLFIGILASFVR